MAGHPNNKTPEKTPRRIDWSGPATLGALLLGVSLGAMVLLAPGLSSQQLPDLTADDVGRPFRANSAAGFKASRDFEVADETQTARDRAEAKSRVRPVFDYDSSVESKVKRGVQEAFAALQSVAAEPVPEAALLEDGGVGAKLTQKEVDAEVSRRLKAALERFEATAVAPDPEDVDIFVNARFAPELEHAVVALIEVAYRAKIVVSRPEMSRVDASGITVRVLGGSTEYELLTQAPQVMDLKEAAAELDRYASVPGNVLPEVTLLVRRAVLRLARKQVRANLSINIAEGEARRRAAEVAVKPVVLNIKKGQRIIGDGELVTETHLLIIRNLRAQMSEFDIVQLQIGIAGVVALLLSSVWICFGAALRRFRPTTRDAVFMGLLLLLLLGILQAWTGVADAVHDRYPGLPIEALYFAFPVATGAMLVRFVLSDELALFFGLVFAAVAGVMLGNSLSYFLFTVLTSLVAAERISRAKDRGGIFRAGLVTGVMAAVLVIFLGFAEGRGLGGESLLGALFAFLSSAVALPMLVLTLTPLVEAAFGYASDLKLLELANLNHPALKDLVLQAPGTYHHSIIMGSLVEHAAEAIGANPLLARSCAYYHDIGKGRNPAFFGENQKGENPHDELAPAMSAVIIKRHVTEGLEMARQYKLPRRVADAIPEHHGTRLVGYFFHKANKEFEGKENAPPVDEAVYRYPGPRPQSRETALVMIADAVEAASRSMPDPTSEKLRALVQKIINMVFSEGQLDECDLTLKDLHVITESCVHTLDGIYHARPAYPAGAVGDQRVPQNEIVKSLSVVKSDEPKRAGT